MKTGQASEFRQTIRALQPRQMRALPVTQPILAALKVRKTVNRLLPSQADVDQGQVVVLLVLNRLLAPQPLYEIQDWLGETILPEVLGIFVFVPYQGVWRPFTSEHNGNQVTDRVLVVWSAAKEQLDQNRRTCLPQALTPT